jgi:hypothetical protein
VARGETGRSILALGLVFAVLPPFAPWRGPSIVPVVHEQRFSLPLVFEPNRGQAPPGVRFLARVRGFRVLVGDDGLSVAAPGGSLPRSLLHPLQANAHARVVGRGRLPGQVSYFIGDDPRHWRTGIPTFAAVVERDVYPGIDLIVERPVASPTGMTLAYEWSIRPGGDAGLIQLVLPRERPVVARQREADGGAAPLRAFEVIGGVEQSIGARYVQQPNGAVGVRLARHDQRRTVQIDPAVGYSMLLGGSSWDYAAAVGADRAGNVYVAGATGSSDFPLRHSVQRANHGGLDDADTFVAKLSPSGKTLLYSTYLGGGADDAAAALAVDRRGQAYVTGFTESPDFPTQHAVAASEHGRCNTDRHHAGDAFVVKLAPTGGALVYSTCLGGSASDWGTAIAVSRGRAYVAGTTASRDFPTAGASPAALAGRQDAFVAGIGARGGSLLFSRLLGGDGDENANAIAGGDGALWVAGSMTASSAVDPVQSMRAGNTNGFLIRLSLDGQQQLGETYLGGAGDDVVSSLAVGGGRVCLAGATTSTGFPVRNAVQSHATGKLDAFVSCFDSFRHTLVASTYLGGNASTRATGIALDRTGDVWITGGTTSPDFPTSHPVQGVLGGGQTDGDAIVAELPVDGGQLLFSSYLGGQGEDIGEGIAVTVSGRVVVVGGTSSPDFPVASVRSGRRPPRGNAFVAEITGGAGMRRGD